MDEFEAGDDWERVWAAYDEPTYQAVLAQVRTDDVVLEIGAGDLRLARRLAERTRRVYAVEIQPDLVAQSLRTRGKVPDNLHVIVGDARQVPFPPGITCATLLMRHCRHFGLYINKLAVVNCKRLITNARWRMGVEVVDLLSPRQPFDSIQLGWYACWCGATGFVPGPPEHLTAQLEQTVYQVIDCPKCK